MNNSGSFSRFLRRGIPRRKLVHATMGAAGAALGSGLWTPARADDDNTRPCAVPLPQVHTTAGPFGPLHFYFPGPIDGSLAATDGTGTHPEGRDPSTITTFSFHTDTRFMKGDFIGSDERMHSGAFAFI